VLYVRGYRLADAQWMIGGQLLAVGVEYVEPDFSEDPDGGETVKLTFPEDAPSVSGVLEAFVDDSVVTASATTVSVAKRDGTDWRRYGVYRALACGEEYGGVVGECGDMAPGLSAITIVRSTVHESQVAGQTVRLEKIEDSARTAAFPSTVIVNHVPRDALELGYYQFATTSCPPNNACASIFIDFQYREEEIVERYGSVCRRTSSQYHHVEPWVWLLGERFPVTDLMAELIAGIWPSFQMGPEQRADSGLLPCGEILATYPEPRPFDLGEHGAVIPHAGWTQM